MINHYEVLNVSEHASEQEIKRSYKKLALKLHPDRIPGLMRAEKANVTEAEITAGVEIAKSKFQKVSAAHDVLTDAQKRKQFDDELADKRAGRSAAPVVGLPGFFGSNLDALFADLPEGVNVGARTVQLMVTEIDAELQRIIDKESTNRRYHKVAAVLSDLKSKIAESKDVFLPNLSAQVIVSAADYNDFLIQSLLAIQQAIDTKEPETHRGILRGTPIVRELTMLVVALLRLIMFIFQKLYKFVKSDPVPVYSNGLFQGLFKPASTRTLTNLNKMQDELGLRQALAKNHLEGTNSGGKIFSDMSVNFDFDTHCLQMRR